MLGLDGERGDAALLADLAGRSPKLVSCPHDDDGRAGLPPGFKQLVMPRIGDDHRGAAFATHQQQAVMAAEAGEVPDVGAVPDEQRFGPRGLQRLSHAVLPASAGGNEVLHGRRV